MKIGLVDVDGHNFPNLALMKLSAYHKEQGDEVGWANCLEPYDKIYMAKVFTNSQEDIHAYQCTNVIRGGTGYDLTSRLPEDVEEMYPDYGLYSIDNVAYGYLTRGCPRGCAFCIVGEKEGLQSRKVADLSAFWRGQKEIKLLDPNLLAAPEAEELLEQLVESKAKVDFTQGIDIRLMTDKKAELLRRVKIKTIHFAWDNPDDKVAEEKLKQYAGSFGVSQRNQAVYVLTNFGSTHEEDVYRVEKIREYGYVPYMMIFEKESAPLETRQLQRYVNNRILFWATSFVEYQKERGKRV